MSHADSQTIVGCFSAGGLTINAGGAATCKTVNTVQIMYNGKMKAVSAFTAQAFPSSPSLPVQPVSTTYYYLVTVKWSDASKRIFGPTELLNSSGTNVGNNVMGSAAITSRLPRAPEGFVPVGAISVTTDSSTTFTPGTTALDAAGLTVTYTDLAGMYPTFKETL